MKKGEVRLKLSRHQGYEKKTHPNSLLVFVFVGLSWVEAGFDLVLVWVGIVW